MSTPANAPTIPEAAVSRGTIGKLLVLLILAGGLAYCNSFTKPFQMDDYYWIVHTDKIKDFGGYVRAAPFRAIVIITLYLNYRFHELNVFGYHLVNLAFHIGAALVLFGVVRRTLLLPRWEGRYAGSAHWLAFAIALLWMVHPLQTESVTYIIQRCESMMGFFYLLAIYCMVRGTQAARAWPWYVASWWCCILGAGCKEVMITVIPVLLAYDRLFIAGWRDIWRQRRYFYLTITAIWLAPLLIVVPALIRMDLGTSAGFYIEGMSPQVYWMTQAWVILYYLRLCIIPYPQYFGYRGWEMTTTLAEFWPAGLIVGLMLLATAWLLWRRNGVGFLGLCFFSILSITSFIPLLDVVVEHRLYLPLAAVCTLVVIGVDSLCRWIRAGVPRAGVGTALLTGAAAACIALTMARNEDYRSRVQLWLPVHEQFPRDYLALEMIAAGYQDEGKLREAADYSRKCLEIAPGMFQAQYNYGILLCRSDQPAEGLRHLLFSLKLIENNVVYTEWTAQIHYDAGKNYLIAGNLKLAEVHLRKAVEMRPSNAQYHSALALVLDEERRPADAQASYERALALDKDWPKKAVQFAGDVLYRYPVPSKWTRQEGLFFAKQAVQATQNNHLATIGLLAEAYAANGMYSQAVAVARDALARFQDGQHKEQLDQLAGALANYQRQAGKTKTP
jgi:Tfp pilus assembly protein PilF